MRRVTDTLLLAGKLGESTTTPLDQWTGATAIIQVYRKSDKTLVLSAAVTLDVSSYPIKYNYRGAPGVVPVGSYYYLLVVTLSDTTIESYPNDKSIYDLLVHD